MPKFDNQRKGRSSPPPAANALAVIQQYEIVNPQCKVCQFEHRREIDVMLATGWSQASVREHWNRVLGDDYFTKNNISGHARNHLSTRDAATRRAIEARARNIDTDIEEVVGSILTREGVVEAVVQGGMEALANQSLELTAKDLLAAVKLAAELEAENRETSIDEIMREFKVFTEAVKEVVGEELYGEIFERFESKLDELNPRVVTKPERPAIEAEASFVEDEEE